MNIKKYYYKIKDIVINVINVLNKYDIFSRSAALSFYMIIAIAPISYFVLEIISLFNVDLLHNNIEEVIPFETFIADANAESINKFSITSIVYIFLIFHLISKFLLELYKFITILYDVEERRILDKIRMFILIFILLLFMIVLSSLLVFTQNITSEIIAENTYFVRLLFNIIRFFIILIVPIITLTILYKGLVRIRYRLYTYLIGAVITYIFWLISTSIFAYYLQYIADYSEVYGAFAIIVMLLYWLYIISIGFLIGIYFIYYINQIFIKRKQIINN